MLVLGIDHGGEYTDSGVYVSGGQADSIFILSVYNTKKTVSTVQLNRDTMTDVHKLGAFGDPVATLNAQIATAYAYGSGGIFMDCHGLL